MGQPHFQWRDLHIQILLWRLGTPSEWTLGRTYVAFSVATIVRKTSLWILSARGLRGGFGGKFQSRATVRASKLCSNCLSTRRKSTLPVALPPARQVELGKLQASSCLVDGQFWGYSKGEWSPRTRGIGSNRSRPHSLAEPTGAITKHFCSRFRLPDSQRNELFGGPAKANK